MERKASKQGIVWGAMLILFGVLALLDSFADLGLWTWVAILGGAGLIAAVVYLIDRADWGLLIQAYVFWAIAGLLALIKLDILQDEWIATYVLGAIGLPFLLAFLFNRSQWGLLVPAYVMGVLALMIGLIGADVLTDMLIPAYVMLAIAIPFLLAFVRNRANWWALIPGGIMTVIGLSFLLAEGAAQYILPVAVILAGVVILVRQFARPPAPADEPAELEAPNEEPLEIQEEEVPPR